MSLRGIFSGIFGWRVIAGPFRGLRYVPEGVGSVLPAKLLGAYERELRPQIARLVARAPDVIVNIGAGEGYYAIGLARCLPQTRVIAYEGNPHGRELISRLATLNGVAARVEVRGLCAMGDLKAALEGTQRPVVVIDAEGAEEELLDPVRAPDLARCAILVEVHDFIAPLGELLLGRFSATHRHQEIWSQPRLARDLPGLTRLIAFTPWRSRAVAAMDERRPGPMRWFWLEPRSH